MNEQDTQLNTLFQKAKNVSLKTEEKAALHGSLAAFMESNPIGETTKRATAQPSPLVMNPRSGRLNKTDSNTPFQLFTHQKKTNMIIALLLAFGLTAGTSFAAQNTLPGDVLYPVKIHLNEEVESIVAVGAKADAEVKAKHALTRLEEAEKLKADGRLTVENKGKVEHQFQEDVKEMKKDLNKLHAQGETETETKVRGRFNQNAETHRKNLLVIHADGTEDVEHSIHLGDLLDGDDHDEADRNDGDHENASSSVRRFATTTLRVGDDEEEHRGVEQEDSQSEAMEKGEVEFHADTELNINSPKIKTGVTGGIRSTTGL